MSKHWNSDRSAAEGKRQRECITLEKKLDMIEIYECNESTFDIANARIILELPLRTISKQADNIEGSCKSAVRMMTSKTTQIRVPIMEKLERMLAQWMEHKCQCCIPVSTIVVQVILFDKINDIETDSIVLLFAASAM
jgi:hypothetical protein